MDTTQSILTLAVASANPVKIAAAKEAFEAAFGRKVETISLDVPSGVSAQPMTYEETRQGAENRVKHAVESNPDADFYIAYEGGVDVYEDGPKTFAILCVSNGRDTVFGQSATLPLPLKVYAQLLQGVELGNAMDSLFNTVNIKQKGGAIGQLSNGIETRKSIYQSATVLALSRFMNAPLYM